VLSHSSGASCLYAWLKAMVGIFFPRFSKCFGDVAMMLLLHQPNVEYVSIVLFLLHRLYFSTISLHHLHFLSHIYCAILQQWHITFFLSL
jgi:hypothetical protein